MGQRKFDFAMDPQLILLFNTHSLKKITFHKITSKEINITQGLNDWDALIITPTLILSLYIAGRL